MRTVAQATRLDQVLFLLLLAALAAPGQAQRATAPQDSLTPDRALSIRRPSDLRFSPDGRHLAFVVTEPPDSTGASRHVWMLDVATRSVRQFTNSSKSDWSPRWSPDGRQLAFVSNRSGSPHLYFISPDGGEARAITSGALSPSGIAWSPDASRIVFLARDTGSAADPRLVDRTDRRTRVWLLEVAAGTVRALTPPDWEVAEAVWTPSGGTLVIEASDRPESDAQTARIWTLDVATDSLRAIAAPRGYFTDLQVSPDGRAVAYIDCRVDGPWPHDLTVMPLPGGAARNLTGSSLDRMIQQYAWEPGGSLVALAADGFATRLVRLASPAAPPVTIPLSGTLDAFAVSPSGALAFVREGATEPPELYLRDGRAVAAPVSHLNDSWRALALITPRHIAYRSFDGAPIDAELLVPADSAGSRPPLVTLVHGGPTGRWSDAIDPLGQILARHGFAVFYPNVRGSLGYGQRFMEANRADWGGGDFKDVMAGIDTLIARGLVDSTRLGIGGWSYGGYLSAWAVTQTQRFRAAVVGGGIADLISEIGTEYSAWYDEWFNGWPADHPERFLGRSPVRFAAAVRTPVLILHGENDDIDPLGQAQELYRSLKHYGVTTELVVYPRESHHINERQHQLDRFARIVDWFSRYMRP